MAAAVPRADGNRVEYGRDRVTEWIVNGPLGLQHGFTLMEEPGVPGHGAPLTLALALAGNLAAQVDEDGRGLTLAGADGMAVLRYAGLAAYDAAGRTLPAWLEIQDQQLLVRVDDARARYPLVIDPFVQRAKLTASDGVAKDRFGTSVAVDGDTVVVGADRDDSERGAAYVFVKPAAGWATTSTYAAKLTASDRAEDDNLGIGVAISGDTVVVGASGDEVDTGAAYVFVKPPGGWGGTINEIAKLTSSDSEVNDRLGRSVAISGDTVVVGAEGDEGYRGAAYVFVKPPGGWTTNTEDGKLMAFEREYPDMFGYSVAISGDTVVAGAYGDDSIRGSAYVFVKPPGGWSGAITAENAKLVASDGAAGDWLGYSAAISGDTVVAGARHESSNKGTAYVFVRPLSGGWSGTISHTAKLTASDGVGGDFFGDSVAVDGDRVAVGAGVDDGGRGSAYVFVKPLFGGWADGTENIKLTASDGAVNAYFGSSAALSGGTLVVGAYGDDSNRGSAYVFVVQADLSISKTDGQAPAMPGQPITYTIVVSNSGPSAATGAIVSDTVPAAITGAAWSCTASSGSYCGVASGTGNINTPLYLTGGRVATLTLTGTVMSSATGWLVNTATITVPVGVFDPNLSNNTATDSDRIGYDVFLPAVLKS